MNDGLFFLCAMGRNCTVATDSNSTRLVPQLVMTSDMRADALLWAACALLFYDRRPPICHETVVTAFNRRYAFAEDPLRVQRLAPMDSAKERELLRFLTFLSQSAPLHHVICVEAFMLPVGSSGEFDATIYGCASSTLNRSEWVGFEAREIYELAHDKGWLTNDVLSLMGTKFVIRQNTHTRFTVSYDANGRTIVDSCVRVNFSSNGSLYALVIFIDAMLLIGRFAKVVELLKWMSKPEHCQLQAWMYELERRSRQRKERSRQPRLHDDGNNSTTKSMMAQNKTPSSPQDQEDISHRRQENSRVSSLGHRLPYGPLWSSSGAETTSIARGDTHRRLLARRFMDFNEVEFYSIFPRPMYRSDHVAVMRTVTQLLSWLIILPNSVVWTWSDSVFQKAQGYLCSIKSWVLITMSINAIWGVIVKFDEPRAYGFVSHTRLDKLEIILIGAVIAFLQRQDVFSICEIKWASEGQRVNDASSFQGGYIAHGNTFNHHQDDIITTPLCVTWIVYKALFEIIGLSVAASLVWAALKYQAESLIRQSGGFIRRLRRCCQCRIKNNNHVVAVMGSEAVSPRRFQQVYHRLSLEVALDSPIRALSLIRSDQSLDVAQHDRIFVAPSRYLDSGVLRSDRRIESRVSIAEILRWSPSLADSIIVSQRHIDVASMSKIIRRMSAGSGQSLASGVSANEGKQQSWAQ
ncbi:hypothetical protein PINS_up023994 [Pythium insidiosum]|nr:hypothetical protein PINS_up023994 [Pythium insidiosum]